MECDWYVYVWLCCTLEFVWICMGCDVLKSQIHGIALLLVSLVTRQLLLPDIQWEYYYCVLLAQTLLMMLQVVTGSNHVWNARWLPPLLLWWTYVNLSQGEAFFFVPHWMSLLYSSTASWELECCSDFLWLWHRVAPWCRRVFSPLVMALDNVLFLHSRFYCEGSCSILNHCQ
jgi:hypothetical protein